MQMILSTTDNQNASFRLLFSVHISSWHYRNVKKVSLSLFQLAYANTVIVFPHFKVFLHYQVLHFSAPVSQKSKAAGDCMRNANKSLKMPYSATLIKVEKWSGICIRDTKS